MFDHRDYPTGSLEAASLLNEAEVTHFLTISPASIPPLPPPSPSPSSSPVLKPIFRPHLPASLSMTPTSSASTSESAVSSPISSRSSSFSGGSRLSLTSSLSPPSTAATSVQSLPLNTQSKPRTETSSSESDDGEDCSELNFLAVSGVQHYHLTVPGPSSVDMLVKLNEGASFIQRSLHCDARTTELLDEGPQLPAPYVSTTPKIAKHVLIHSTIESRGVIVACAYLMQARGLRPSQAYSVVEKGAYFATSP